MSARNQNFRRDQKTVDGEHRRQIELIEALDASLHKPLPKADAAELMEQLKSFCTAHFMSEELLMRQCAYPGYDEHVADHGQAIETLAAIATTLLRDSDSASTGLARIKEFLTAHIRSRDAAFMDYYRHWSETDKEIQLP